MKRNLTIAIVISATLAFVACKKEDKKPDPGTQTQQTQTTEQKPPQPISQRELKLRILAIFEAINNRDVAKLGEFIADDAVLEYVDSDPSHGVKGKAEILKGAEEFFKAFPDAKNEASLVLMNGKNEIVVVHTMTGTNSGEFMKRPATNKAVGVMAARHLVTSPEGKIVKETVYTDPTTMMGQLGLLPPELKFRPVAEFTGNPPKVVATSDSDIELKNLDVIKNIGLAMNAHNAEKTMSYYTDDAVFAYLPGPEDMTGKEAIRKGLDEWLQMTSDVKVKFDWSWAAGDYVVAATTANGTNDGAMPGGMPATGKTFQTHELHVYEFANGQVKHQWIFGNGFAFALQLGLVPPPGEHPAGAPGTEGAAQPTEGAAQPAK